MTGGGWSAWACGSVQDSSTGTNGRCQKQQDGTQTCWHTLTTSTTAEAIWTFPQAFASSTGLIVTMGVNGTALTALSARHTAKSATSVSLSVAEQTGAVPARIVTFNSTATDTAPGSVVTTTWDFGDGSTVEAPAGTVTHTYTAPGDYTVTFSATDNDGDIIVVEPWRSAAFC